MSTFIGDIFPKKYIGILKKKKKIQKYRQQRRSSKILDFELKYRNIYRNQLTTCRLCRSSTYKTFLSRQFDDLVRNCKVRVYFRFFERDTSL